MFKKEKGFTLIEIMVVMAIIAVATILVLQDVAATNKQKQVTSSLEGITSIIRASNLSKDSTAVAGAYFQNLTSSYLALHKMVPNRYLNAAGNGIETPYGGVVNVVQWMVGVNINGYSITLNSLPQDACMDIVGSIQVDTVDTMKTNGLDVLTPLSTTKNYINACNIAGNTNVLALFIRA